LRKFAATASPEVELLQYSGSMEPGLSNDLTFALPDLLVCTSVYR